MLSISCTILKGQTLDMPFISSSVSFWVVLRQLEVVFFHIKFFFFSFILSAFESIEQNDFHCVDLFAESAAHRLFFLNLQS